MIKKIYLTVIVFTILCITFVASNSYLNIKYRHVLNGNEILTKQIAKEIYQ